MPMVIPKRLAQYEIPDSHKEVLVAMCGLPPDADVPVCVRKRYIQYKLAADRVSMSLVDRDLIQIVVSGLDEEIPEKPAPGILALWRDGQIVNGSDVFCTWRNKENTPAKIINVLPDSEIIVRIVGQVDERRLTAEKVYVNQIA